MPAKGDIMARYCPNPDCPTMQAKGMPRYLGESALGEYVRLHCGSCKRWWEWNKDGVLAGEGEFVFEDIIFGT